MTHIIQNLVHLEFKEKRRNPREVCLPFLCILLVLSFLSSVSAHAANYYVAKNGHNSGPGTQSQPWLTLQHAANQVVAGDTVNVRAGTYNERVTLKKSGNAAGGFITFQNFPGEKPILSGSGLGSGNMVYGLNISYFKFKGFHVKNYTGGGIAFEGGGSHLEIRNNEFSDGSWIQPGNAHAIVVVAYTWPGPVYTKITDVIVDNNYIHDVQTGVAAGYNFDEALTLAHNVSKFQITNNILERVSFIGIDVIGKDDHFPQFGIISHNEVKNSGTTEADTGIYVDGGRNIVIERNKVHGTKGHGIVTSAEQGSFMTEKIIVRFNELWNNRRNLSPGSTYLGESRKIRAVHNVLFSDIANTRNIALQKGHDIVLKNNISMNRRGDTHIEHYWGIEFSPSLDFNNYYPSDAKFQYKGGWFLSYDLYQAMGFGSGNLSQDPRFVDVAKRDFHLQSTSPCIDAGGMLTKTTSSGSGTRIPVEDSLYFSDGYGVFAGDLVQIGSNSPVQIVLVNHDTKTLTVDRSISWVAGSGVSYPYIGSAPDLGAYEMGGAGSDLAPKNLRLVGTGN